MKKVTSYACKARVGSALQNVCEPETAGLYEGNTSDSRV